MKYKNQFLSDLSGILPEKIGAEKTVQVLTFARQRLQELLEQNPRESKALRTHTSGTIYPAVSVYEGLQRCGYEKPEAVRILDQACSQRAEKQAQMIRTMMKIPGLYRKMPAIFRWMTVHNFGEAAGFRANFYDTGKDRCKFDMTRCAYFDVCSRLGCPEIVPCFCHTDDVTDGNMHPKLRWHRTKTIGEGGDVCDFEIIVEK